MNNEQVETTMFTWILRLFIHCPLIHYIAAFKQQCQGARGRSTGGRVNVRIVQGEVREEYGEDRGLMKKGAEVERLKETHFIRYFC